MLAKISAEVNSSVENIGARRLHTIIEKVFDDISYNATDKAGETITLIKIKLNKNLGNLVKDTDYQNLYYKFLSFIKIAPFPYFNFSIRN